MNRRDFIKLSTVAGTGLIVSRRGRCAIPGGTLDPLAMTKYAAPLVIPPAMPITSRLSGKGKTADYYEIAVRQFQQQILPNGFSPTTVWGYGSVNHPSTFNYPSFTIEATYNKPVRVKWINDLKDSVTGKFRRHILPVDQTLHWANPPGGILGRDMHSFDPSLYTGPVPTVTHVHGAHTSDDSDGYTEAWYLPNASDIPAGYATEGTWYRYFKNKAKARNGANWDPGSATFDYPNDQRASTLWYHDHSLGMTRVNVYAGPAGFYLLRGGSTDIAPNSAGRLPGPAPQLGDAPGTRYYEIPLAIQDRSFNTDGSLFYPDSRSFFDSYLGPYVPTTPVPPIWNPEFFGNTMVVNGRTWPYLQVEKRRYRLRLLNGCNSRFLILKFDQSGLNFWQIGAEGGFLPKPVQLTQLLMAPAERADVIVDFTNVPAGATITLLNIGPDEPFGGGVPGVDFAPADADTTGQVMQFRVVPAVGRDLSVRPDKLNLPKRVALGTAKVTRQVSLNEDMYDAGSFGPIPIAALLGTVNGGNPNALKWMDTITENPALGATEIWEIYNFTMDAHPIHLHEVQFEVVNRQPIGGAIRAPEPWERGTKDTVIAYPREITRIKSRFDIAGLFVWHCHIVEHEDNEMMRPYAVGAIPKP